MIAAAVVCILLLSQTVRCTEEQQCVTTSLGRVCGVSGVVEGSPITVYYGIPFAEPPVGDLRFRPPEELIRWKSNVDGTKVGKICPQFRVPEAMRNPVIDLLIPREEQDEDCLNLNIFAPNGSKNTSVLVWIHGGGFTSGAGVQAFYDGRIIAALSGAIVVTINYRLGVLGFGYLGVPEMQGNMGLLDQQMALKWVHNNIHLWGGDPSKVTIFGESAGGASVAAHMIAPGSQRYFRAAIAQSGNVYDAFAIRKKERRANITMELAKGFQCSGEPAEMVQCLKGLDASQLGGINIFDRTSSNGVAALIDNDGLFFTKPVEQLLNETAYTDKQLIIGTNENEGTLLMSIMFIKQLGPAGPWSINQSMYEQFAEMVVDPFVSAEDGMTIIEHYDNLQKYGSYIKCLEESLTDFWFFQGSQRFARALSRRSNHVRLYLFNVTSAESPIPASLGATHGAEIAFVFGDPFRRAGYPESEKEVSREMVNIWSSLANRE